jgi:hypothetical protein
MVSDTGQKTKSVLPMVVSAKRPNLVTSVDHLPTAALAAMEHTRMIRRDTCGHRSDTADASRIASLKPYREYKRWPSAYDPPVSLADGASPGTR